MTPSFVGVRCYPYSTRPDSTANGRDRYHFGGESGMIVVEFSTSRTTTVRDLTALHPDHNLMHLFPREGTPHLDRLV